MAGMMNNTTTETTDTTRNLTMTVTEVTNKRTGAFRHYLYTVIDLDTDVVYGTRKSHRRYAAAITQLVFASDDDKPAGWIHQYSATPARLIAEVQKLASSRHSCVEGCFICSPSDKTVAYVVTEDGVAFSARLGE